MCYFFNDTATAEIYTLSLHDALPIYKIAEGTPVGTSASGTLVVQSATAAIGQPTWLRLLIWRSEEHTSELQSRQYLVCRLLLEKKRHRYVLPPPYGRSFLIPIPDVPA